MIGSDFSALSEFGYFAVTPPASTGTSTSSPDDPSLSGTQPAAASGSLADTFLYRKRPEAVPETAQSDNAAQEDAQGSQAGVDQALTEEELKQIEELKKRDAEVRRHEEAHMRTGGRYAGTPKYDYQTGPDGKRYAIGGSVDIDTSEVPGDPEATIEKARIIKRAALAPEEPSTQDRKVAREADQMAARAQREQSEAKADTPDDEPGEAAETATSTAAKTDPHAHVAATTSEETTAVEQEVLKVDPQTELDLEVASAQQSLMRYKTSQLRHFYMPINARLNMDNQRIALLPIFDQYA